MNNEDLLLREKDPIKLSKSLFCSTLWAKQEEIIRSVWKNKYTAVKSCNTGGKTRVAAEIALLYSLLFRPSRVVTTAPTFLQVEQILWKEIAALYNSSKAHLGGQLTKTRLDFGTIDGKPWDLIGFSTDEVNRFQGWHSEYLFCIFDEALGVDARIWEAAIGLRPHRWLVIGNPLDPSGEFYNCFQSSLWNKITISGYDCVKWQEENEEIPGLITREWIEERREEWGENSPLFQARVLGEFPEDSPSLIIQRKWVEACRQKEPEDNEEDELRVGACDVASKHGDSETVITYRYAHTIKEIHIHRQIPITKTRDELCWMYSDKKLGSLVFDSDGMGEGLNDMLVEKHVPFSAFHGGYASKAIDQNRYRNLRTQFYCVMAKKFEKGMYSLKGLPEREYELLKNQLCCMHYKLHDGTGRIQIETKDDLAGRGIKSPDLADSMMMSEYGYWMGRSNDAFLQGFSYR